ncbi:MAG: c-type cytochrome [Isosphaeraceae bacterium]
MALPPRPAFLRLLPGLLAFGIAGCDDSLSARLPIPYARSEQLQTLLGEKPNLRDRVMAAVDGRFGPEPMRILVPADSGLPDGGLHLAGSAVLEGRSDKPAVSLFYADPETSTSTRQAGGHALYRRHCLQCHGVSGDGDGVTAPFLIPRPRDYRRGIFKFTSTGVGSKPTRDDLRKTILHGLPGTSMPPYETLMSAAEVEQVIDYVTFLSMRGEYEYRLIQEAKDLDDSDPNSLEDDILEEDLQFILNGWKDAPTRVVMPEQPRTPVSPESLERGRKLFLGQTKEQLQCASCHGTRAKGDGPTWIDQATYNHYVYNLDTSRERFRKLEEVAKSKNKKWGDDWGDPIRPANLNKRMYKGGLRPIDIFWRIRNGIGQEVMPAHANLTADQVWDLVNLVLELPYRPKLLEEGGPPSVASR